MQVDGVASASGEDRWYSENAERGEVALEAASSIRYMGYLTTRPSKRELFRRYQGRIAWSNGAISPTLGQMFPLTWLPHLLPSETASTP